MELQAVPPEWRNSPIDIDVENEIYLAIAIIAQAVTDVGHSISSVDADAREFFEGAGFQRFAAVLDLSDESVAKILSMVEERKRGIKRLCSNRSRFRMARG